MHGGDPTVPPLLPPVPREGWTDAVRQFFAIMEGPQTIEHGTRFNAQAVMANHVELATAWAQYNKFIARETDLSARLREVAILRTAWNLQAGYEWYQHRIIARRAGFSEAELEAIRAGASDPVWGDEERLVIRAADETCTGEAASPETVTALLDRFGPRQLLEILWVVGTYAMLARIFNSLRIPIEDFCVS